MRLYEYDSNGAIINERRNVAVVVVVGVAVHSNKLYCN